jgi:hypothetical protein
MSEIQENNTQETLNETHNQNVDTQFANEEAPVQTEAPQNNQDIGAQEQSTFAAAEPPAQEEGMNPADIADPAVTTTLDDLVGSDPKVTMNPEDLSGPETAENTSDFLAGDETDAPIDLEAMDSLGEVFAEDDISPTVSEDDDWDVLLRDTDGDGVSDIRESEPSDTEAVSMPTDKIVDPVPTEPENTGVVPPWLQEPSNPLPTEPEDSRNPGDQEAERDGNESPENTGTNPDMSDGGGYTYDEGAYEDAEDAFEDLQDALQDGDEEDLAEALEELQGYLGGFNHPVRLQPAGEVRLDLRGRGQPAAPALHGAPRPLRLHRAVLRAPDRALFRGFSRLAGADPGGGHTRLGPQPGLRPEGGRRVDRGRVPGRGRRTPREDEREDPGRPAPEDPVHARSRE